MIWAVQKSLCDMRNIPSLPHADLSIESAVTGELCVCVWGGGGGGERMVRSHFIYNFVQKSINNRGIYIHSLLSHSQQGRIQGPHPPFGGPPNFIKREKTPRVCARKSRVLVLNSYPDPPLSEILYPPLASRRSAISFRVAAGGIEIPCPHL